MELFCNIKSQVKSTSVVKNIPTHPRSKNKVTVVKEADFEISKKISVLEASGLK